MSITLTTAPALEATLNFLGPVQGRLRTYTFDPPNGEPRSNQVEEPHLVPIHDLRRAGGEATLDAEGFALIHAPSEVHDFDDDAAVRSRYWPESARILQAVTGADRVHVFDHTIRRHRPGIEDRKDGQRQPVQRVHVDQTVKSGPKRVRDLLPEEADELLRGRVQIINLWRPLIGPLRDSPLALGDAASVAPEDLVPADLVFPDRVGETYAVRHNPGQRWFYAPEMRPEEALLLKCYDSAEDGRARFSPHTAFTDPTTPPDAPKRQSIELRALVFHKA